MPIASSRPLCTSTWRPFAMSHSQQELGQHAQALGAMSHSPPLRTQLPSSCGPYIWIIQTCFNLIIFSNHGFKYKCKNWWLIHSRHTSTAKVSTRWKWARWPDPVMCSYIDVTPHCNIQPHHILPTAIYNPIHQVALERRWQEVAAWITSSRWKGGTLPRQCFTLETVIKIGRDQLRSISPLPNMNLRLNEDKEDILEQTDINRALFLKIWFHVFHLPCSQFHGARLGMGFPCYGRQA